MVVTVCSAGRVSQTAVFTADTLFADGVWRPDLHADPEGARVRTDAL